VAGDVRCLELVRFFPFLSGKKGSWLVGEKKRRHAGLVCVGLDWFSQKIGLLLGSTKSAPFVFLLSFQTI
jgi:hypothetical protein